MDAFFCELLAATTALAERWNGEEMAGDGNPPQGKTHRGGQMRESLATTKKHNVKCKDKLSRST